MHKFEALVQEVAEVFFVNVVALVIVVNDNPTQSETDSETCPDQSAHGLSPLVPMHLKTSR